MSTLNSNEAPVAASVAPSSPLKNEELIAQSLPQDWIPLATLGKGSFGEVKLVKHKDKPDLVAAMKIVPIRDADPAKPLRHCTDPNNEWKEMQKLNHDFIVRCYRAWRVEHTRTLYILLEYVEGKDLKYCITNSRGVPLADETIGRFFVQLLWALWYMEHINDCGDEKHPGMFHRDLKPENILLTSQNLEDASAKITDFGFARTLPPSSAGISVVLSTCGTMPYMSPERLRKEVYGCPSDIWSLGLILVEMITKQHLFQRFSSSLSQLKEAQLYVADWLRQTLPGDYGELTELILGMLEFDPVKRWTPEAIAQHPWVQGHLEMNGISLVMPESLSQIRRRAETTELNGGNELSDLQ